MATAAGDSTAYGGGAGGKFRKRPFRRAQTTPYERPVTALRNPRSNSDNDSGGSGGWLSRIVDPASKLISASAHKLFSSVFRKRLLPPPPPPPPQPSPDEKVEHSDNHLGDVATEDPSRIQEREINEGNTDMIDSATDGVTKLEHMLKQKTFTRSEIDRLTVLLRSRTVDKTGVAGQGKIGATPDDLPAANSKQEELDGTACENGVNPSEIPGTDLTPALKSKVKDDNVASPAELAKAYMGSRPMRVSPSMLSPWSQAVREEAPAFTTFQSHGPSVSSALKPSSTACTSQNDFVVPRSRGRSAIYSMARTPYSRVHPTAIKGLATSNDAFDGRSLLSSQKALKRRCSVLENDIGAVGPIRRIRQKPNLHHPKTLGLPSRTPFTHTIRSEVGEASLYSSSKSQEDRGDKNVPLSSSHVSSKSIEMGQRILQQLEKLTPPKEKPSEKKSGISVGMPAMELTPGMLHGQARKSLETVDSLKYLQSDQISRKIVDSSDVALREMRDSTPEKQDQVYDSGCKVLVNSSSNVFPNNDEASITENDVTKTTAPIVLKSAAEVPKKSRAFQMSAYEDCFELDDDAHSNGVVSALINEGTKNLEASLQSNGNILPENPLLPAATKVDTPPACPELNTYSNSALKKNNAVESSTDPVLKKTAPSLQPIATSVSDNSDIPASTISFGLKSSDKASSVLYFSSSDLESSVSKDVNLPRPSSVFAFAADATDAAVKSPGSNSKSTDAVDMFKKSDNAPLFSVPGSTISTFSFEMPAKANASTGSTSSLGSYPMTSSALSPVLFSSQTSSSGSSSQSTFTASPATTVKAVVSSVKVGGDGSDSTTPTIAGISSSSSSLTSSVAFPSVRPGLTFGGSSVASESAVMATSGTTEAASKTKETIFGNSTSSNFSGAASATTPSSTTVSFQFGAPTSSSANSQPQSSHNVSSQSIFGDQILPSAAASASTTQSTPSQPAASTLSASSGSSSLAINFGGNQFGSLTSVSAPFSSNSTFGSSSSESTSMTSSGSASSASTSIFGGSWQSTNAPVFGSTFNSSSGFSFGASSASTPSSNASSGFAFGATSISAPANGNSAVVPFGASSSSAAAGSSSVSSGLSFGASSGSTSSGSAPSGFSFGTASVSTPANGSSTGVPFGSAPTPAASGSTPSVFAFGASSSAPSSTTSSLFSFGASSASGSGTATPAPVFSFNSVASTPVSTPLQPSQPAFGSSSSVFPFGSTPPPSSLGNNDQMSTEDTMVEDSMQSSTPTVPGSVFGQSPTSNFVFGTTPTPAPSGANPFQFGGQQNQVPAPQNPFQNSGSFDGGSFSLGAGGNDKSTRKFIKVRNRNRKK